MAKKRKFDRKKALRISLQILVAILIIPFFFFSFYFGKIYPGVKIAGIEVSGKTPEEALKIVSEKTTPPQEVVLSTNKIPTSSFSLSYDFNKTATAAYLVGRSGNIFYDIYETIKTASSGVNIGIRTNIDEEALYKSLSAIAGEVSTDAVYPSATIVNGKVVVDPGKKGQEVDLNRLRILIGQNLAFNQNSEIAVPVVTVDHTLNAFELAAFQSRADILMNKSIKFTFEDKEIVVKGNELLSLLGKTSEDLVQKIAIQINRPVSEPKLIFEEGRVKEFNPARNGVSVKQNELKELIAKSLESLEKSEDKEVVVQIPVSETTPKVKTEDVNNLGIKELIGRGKSTFRGSIPSRVYNVNLAATRISGTLIAPGETFSFLQTIGDISKLTGFKEAYIISGGKTILGDGGGVCQVSTTLFRAALNAGLPIVERHAHAYRVYYYEQDAGPGFDATVFSPTVDFKFKNDTPGNILIQAYPDTKNYSLVFELYGTKDGRVATLGKPVITSTTAPPPDVYQDDPTLPAGTIKQTEHRALGTKTYFTYEVTRNGEQLIKQTFNSSFRPWANVFLRGIGPVN